MQLHLASILVPHDAPDPDGCAIFAHMLADVMGCDQLVSTILIVDRINTIHDVLALPVQYGAQGLSYIVPQGRTEQDCRSVTIGDLIKLRQLIAFNITNLKYNRNQPIDYANVTAASIRSEPHTLMILLLIITSLQVNKCVTLLQANRHHNDCQILRLNNSAKHRNDPRVTIHHLKRTRKSTHVRWVEPVGTIAATHDTLLDVLNPSYIPTTEDDIKLFELKNMFMFSVFLDHTVKTYAGTETFLRQCSNTLDAQELSLTDML
jgi:hypothetical protein